jgi:cytochrome c oxidase subunit 2
VNDAKTPYYPVICTELCGLGHALMRSKAIVLTQAAYTTWYRGSPQPRPKPGGGGGTPASVIFTQNGCGACHEFKAIPAAVGKIGPSLDNVQDTAKAAGMDLVAYIKQSIVDPNAYVVPGYQPNVMPSTFGSTMTATQINALTAYIAKNQS